MKTSVSLKRVQIFIDETDKFQNKNLSVAIVEKAKQIGCAGATVMRGIMGYGAHRRVHTASLVDMSINLPEVIMVIDEEEMIDKLLLELETMMKEGLVVVDQVEGYKYTPY